MIEQRRALHPEGAGELLRWEAQPVPLKHRDGSLGEVESLLGVERAGHATPLVHS
jgi:hypothetical protein